MNRAWLFVPLILALLLGSVFYSGLGKDPTKLESALRGNPVPAFSLPLLGEPERQVGPEVLKGQFTLVNFWATWCPSCYREHPYLMTLANNGVNLIGVNYKDKGDEAMTWLHRHGNPYKLTIYDHAGTLGFDMGVYGAPETFLVDPAGIILFRHAGIMNEAVWQEKFLPLMQRER
jgi:cytochrome c biogenesis protein CcmG, thiol:disulfide interchange protein DsbE